MKFFLFFVFSLTLFFQFNCQSPPPSTPAVSWGPETIPNSTIRKIEIDQIRIGDNMIRASAVLGTLQLDGSWSFVVRSLVRFSFMYCVSSSTAPQSRTPFAGYDRRARRRSTRSSIVQKEDSRRSP